MRSLFRRKTRAVKAVDGITFTIASGERVGFLGPNGAGKTTTLKMLAGLLHPTSGSVSVDGHRPELREEAYLKHIMLVMGQKQQLLWDLPPMETIELNRAIYEVPTKEFQERLDELVALLSLEKLLYKPTRQLSLGERMKCELAVALLHGPKVLFLDEPTIGLDASMQIALRSFILRYNERHQATIILTSHDMDDVAALCPRVIVIDHGRIVFDGPIPDLVQRIRPEKRVTLRFSRVVERSELSGLSVIIDERPGEVVIQIPRSDVSRVVADALARLPVVDLNVENPPLEEVMSELFSRKPEGTV